MAHGFGKAILLGEHAVVYGFPGLATSLDRGVQASATPAEAWELNVMPWRVDVVVGEAANGTPPELAAAWRAVIEEFVRRFAPVRPHRVEASVDLPAGAGLGCSAALGVAAIRALSDALALELTDNAIVELSLVWERVFHGNPSGLDSSMATVRGVGAFVKGQELELLPSTPRFWLVIADSGESSSTREVVSMVARERERKPEQVTKTFEAIEALVRNARLALIEGDWRALGQLMDLNQILLSSLMLSTESIEELCHIGREAGALGAKLTGAGGGGCVIALADSPKLADEICARSMQRGFEAFVACCGGNSPHA